MTRAGDRGMVRRRSRAEDPFDGFTQVEEIGRGAFATVYRAMDAYTGQPFALKLLTIRGGRKFDHTTFELEAKALGKVSEHPNIVSLHRAAIRPDGQPLLVLELCDGSLADRLRSHGPLPVREVVASGIKLAGALETAHRAGVLHRDLKPHNVLVTRYGEPALADFGVAELRDAVSGGSPLSGLTLLHAAPEIILGRPATPASDVYGLVSTLYELLHGHAPHYVTTDEDPAVVQRRVLHDPVPRLEAPGLPSTIRELLERSLAKAPDDRPNSALELAQGLRLLERATGWSVTPCPVDGVTDIALPDPPADTDTGTSGRAAATTGLPPLGLGGRPFSDQPVRTRDLDPVATTRPTFLPSADRELLPAKRPSAAEPAPDQPAPGHPAPDEPAPQDTTAEDASSRDPGEDVEP